MARILLINPNTSTATTAMMTDIARACMPENFLVEGITATTGPAMILDPASLAASEAGVVEAVMARRGEVDGVLIAAFGDPGIKRLRILCRLPVTGLCEASMQEAAGDGKRFGIATVTPQLVGSFSQRADELGLSDVYTGTRLTPGDPRDLVAHPARLLAALERAVWQCHVLDGAQAVIIGGGPLGQAAASIQETSTIPVIAPIPAAVRKLVSVLRRQATETD